MSEKDKIKKCALVKYKKYVESELARLNDGCLDGSRLSITDFEPMPPLKEDYTDVELKVLMPLIKRLQETAEFLKYCERNGMDLSKYSNIKGLCQN